MDVLTSNLETIRQSCRVCLQKGDINIWDFKVKFTTDETNYTRSQYIDVSAEGIPANVDADEGKHISTLELLEIFNKTTDSLVLTDEFPLLCWQCLEDFRLCYIFYEKVKNSNMQLEKIYDECINQCIEEEHLIEAEDKDLNPEVINFEDIQQLHINNSMDIPPQTAILPVKSPEVCAPQRRTLDKNSSIVVAQYVPSTMEPPLNIFKTTNPEDDEEFQAPRNLHTVDCKTVEISDVSQLESLETSSIVVLDNEHTSTSPPVFVCQYCPQAFAKSEFLKTHIQRNHVCKFCMQTFHQYIDLCQHLRQHKEHKCVICQKMLSSQTNLRHHIKRIHRISLPPKMTLLDFIQSTEEDEDNVEVINDTFPEMLVNHTGDTEEETEYVEESLSEIYFSKDIDIGGMMDTDIMDMN